MRLFVALDVNDEVKKKAGSCIESLKGIKGVSLVNPSLFHLTLSFLGTPRAGSEEVYERVVSSLRDVKQDAFSSSTGIIGAFPSWSRARVVWWGINNSPEMRTLKDRVDKALISVNSYFPALKKNESFSPHITLARIKIMEREEHKEVVERLKNTFKSLEGARIRILFDSFALYNSIPLVREGRSTVEYIELERFLMRRKKQQI